MGYFLGTTWNHKRNPEKRCLLHDWLDAGTRASAVLSPVSGGWRLGLVATEELLEPQPLQPSGQSWEVAVVPSCCFLGAHAVTPAAP